MRLAQQLKLEASSCTPNALAIANAPGLAPLSTCLLPLLRDCEITSGLPLIPASSVPCFFFSGCVDVDVPRITDAARVCLQVHYHGTLVDGSTFDSSVLRGNPISFPLNGVIKGWTEGLQLMKVMLLH